MRSVPSLQWLLACAAGAAITACTGELTEPLPTVASVVITPASGTLASLGETLQLSAVAYDAGGNTIAGVSFSWSTSDEACAAVNTAGLVTAAGNGTATITAASAGVSGAASVTVAQVVATVAVIPPSTTLTSIGETAQLVASALDANGHGIAGKDFTWESSDETVATVSPAGLLTAVDNGTASITATSDGVEADADVTVSQEVAVVAVTPATVSLTVLEETVQLTAGAVDAKGHEVADKRFSWESSDESVATVSSAGLVTAEGNGTATITAATEGVGGNAEVTVAQEAATVRITPAAVTLTSLGETAQLDATAQDEGGTEIAAPSFTWDSSDDGVATVSAAGLVTAVANGTAIIMAKVGDVADTVDVTVAQEVAAVSVAPEATTFTQLGETVQLAAAAQDANGHEVAGKEFTWESSDQNVASVSSAGLVAAETNGVATITATTDDVGGEAEVTVAQQAASVELSPIGASLSGAAATQQFTVEAWDAGGSAIPGQWMNATWTSLNGNVATVDPVTGAATAVGVGQVTIQVDVDGVVDYAVLTVTMPGLTEVNLWAQEESGITGQIEGIWGTSATDVFAAAHGGLVLHYDGTTWSTVFQDISYLNMDVWGSSATDVYVVGHAAKVVHYDGTFWNLMTSGMSDMLSAVWGASPNDIFAVSWDGTFVHFDGASWSPMNAETVQGYLGTWGTSASDVYAVGWMSALHYDGTSWNDISSAGITGHLEDVWATSPTNVYAGGADNVFRYDGATWTRILLAAPAWINAVWGSSEGDIYFAGADTLGNAAVLHYDGTWWRLMRSPIPHVLGSIWGAPTGEVFATGGGGTILRGYRGGTVAVTPSSAVITGNDNQLQLVPSAAAGGTPVAGVTYLWSSSGAGVATVDADGLVTGLADGAATITATAFGGAAATTTVTVSLTQMPPTAVIDSPEHDTTVTLGEMVNFLGTASDADGTIASHQWDFGDGSGASVEDPGPHTYAGVGTHSTTYRVTDDDGATSPPARVVITVVANQDPTATIASPPDQAAFSPGEIITFTGSATDHEDGALAGAALVWTSSLDGQIGTGTSFTRSDLSEGTHRITLTATDSYGSHGSASVTIRVQTQTHLYLRYIDSNNILSNQSETSGYTTITLYNYGSGQSTEFQAVLGNAISGTGYGFSLWLGAGTAPGQTGTWAAEILVEHDGARTTLVTHAFAVPYNNNFLEYTANVTGIPGGAADDTIILRLTLTDVSQGAVRFGPPPLDSRILVPGSVTVSRPTSLMAVSAVEEGGVKVAVTAGQSRRYSGR